MQKKSFGGIQFKCNHIVKNNRRNYPEIAEEMCKEIAKIISEWIVIEISKQVSEEIANWIPVELQK